MSKVFIVALPEEVDYASNILGCPVIFSGVGKINAAIATYKAHSYKYKEIINIGSCGSLKLKPGEVVKVDVVFQDIDCTPLSNYGETLGEKFSDKIVLNEENQINTCFTTDYFFDINQKKKYSKFYLDMIKKNTIFDMECFSLAKTCKLLNIKFSSYKWVSDDGDASHWKENCKIGFEKIKKLLNG